ncbi:hypothetical protein HYW87_04215, partial [Candidatus Roizmanbacteria bacterium]|nr:hypothetical protein [Candidatus Roizmanbacteria bacterium]
AFLPVPETEKDIKVEPLSELIVVLPYFITGDKVIFLDENKEEKLSFSLKDLKLPEGYTKKLCGNGICDFNENILSCFNDCGIRPR